MAHIFISYSRRDADSLRKISLALEAAGHSVWWDVRSIQVGVDWHRAIDTGIVDCDAVILLLSTHSVSSAWVRKELEIARSQHKAILPVRIDGIVVDDFPEFIRAENIHVLDAFSDPTSGFDRLTSDLVGLQLGSRLPFTLAHPRLTEFVGRDQVLRKIHALLIAPKGTGRARVVVCGMGGMGKTQLCIEYVHRYRYFYPDGIVYLDAQANLNEQLACFAPILGLVSSAGALPLTEQRDLSAEAVAQYLRGLRGALLFLDNVPSTRALRQAHIGHSTPILALPVPILLNSRIRYEGPEADRIDLGPLSDEEATVLVSKGRPELRTDPQAIALSRVLGGVPLALALAAAFFSKKPGATPKSYLAELAVHGWEETLSLGHLKAGDIEAYPQASFVPALRAQWNLLELDSSQILLAAAALHSPNTPIPIARLGILSGLSDRPDGMRTELSDAVLEAMTASLAADAGTSRLTLHAVTHDFIRRQAFVDYDQVKQHCLRHAMVALGDLTTVESLFSSRGSDDLVDDLLAMRRVFGDQIEFLSLCGDWLAIIQGHGHVFRALATDESDSAFVQHVLLFSSVRMRDRIEAQARRAFVESGRSFFDVKWSSWLIPENLRTRLLGEGGSTTFLGVSPYATWVLSYTTMGIIQVWTLPSGQAYSRADVGAVRSLAISPSGDRLALLRDTGMLQLLDLPNLRTVNNWHAHPVTLSTIEFASDNLLIGVAVEGDCLFDIDLGCGTVRKIEGDRLDSPIQGIYRLFDNQIFLALQDGQFAVRDPAKAGYLIRGRFSNDNVSVSAVKRESRGVIVCTSQGMLRVDSVDGSVHTINEAFGSGWSTKADFFGDGQYAVSVAHRNSMSLLELINPEELKELSSTTVDDIVAGARRAPVFVSGNSQYSELNVWDLTDGIPRTGRKVHGQEIVNILTVLNGSRFVTTSMDWTAALWDRSTGDKLQTYGGGFEYGYAKGLAKTVADDRFLVGYTFKTCLYDIATGNELHSFKPPCDGVTAIAMAPSGRFFLTGSSDGWLFLWSEFGELLQRWQLGDGEICSIAISADEKVIAGGLTSGSVFTIVDWRRRRQWPAKRGLVNSVCLSPNGALLYSTHHSGEVCAWITEGGGLSYVLQGHSERVSHGSLIANGRILITAAHDGTIRFWCTRRREQLEVLHFGQPVGCFDYYEGDASLLIGLVAGDVLAMTRVGPFVGAD